MQIRPFAYAFFSVSIPMNEIIRLITMAAIKHSHMTMSITFLNSLTPSDFLDTLSLNNIHLIIQ